MRSNKLSIKDLKFPDPERQGILANHIVYSVGIDTGCWDDNSQRKTLDSLLKNKVPIDRSAIIGGCVTAYDGLGHVIYRNHSSCDFFCQHNVANKRFVYDSLGLLRISRGGIRPDSISYVFSPYSHKLLAIHQWHYNNEIQKDSELYVFDNTGMLLFSHRGIRRGMADSTFYAYDDHCRLKSKITKVSLQKDGSRVVSDARYYFYVHDRLDSILEVDRPYDIYEADTNLFYFDSSGLLSMWKLHVGATRRRNSGEGWLSGKRSRRYYHFTAAEMTKVRQRYKGEQSAMIMYP